MTVVFGQTTWIDDTSPSITAAQLNRLEKGIADTVSQLNSGTGLAVVTTLPTTGLVHGLQVLLEVDKAGTYGGPFLWLCRYANRYADGTTRTAAWDVIDAPRMVAYGTALTWNTKLPSPANTSAYVFYDASAPQIPVPVAGTYEVEGSANGYASNAAAGPGIYLAYNGQALGSWDSSDALASVAVSGASVGMAAMPKLLAVPTAGIQVRMYYSNTNLGGGVQFWGARLAIRPTRLLA